MTPAELAKEFGTSLDKGLTPDQYAAALERWGPNALAPKKTIPAW